MSPRGFGSVFSSTRSLGRSRKTTASRRRSSATRRMPLAAESLESRAMLATTATATGSMPLLPPTLVGPSATSADTIARPAVTVAAISAPPSPTGLVAVPGDARVTLTWAAPTSNGGAAISDYVVQVSSNNGATWRPFADGVSTATAATVTGLTNGVRYVFRVAAVNAAGTGAASVASAAIVPRTVPGMPTGVTGVPGDGRVSLAWRAPTSNGGAAISDYVVQVSSNAGATWSTFADGVSTATAATVTGLTNGTSYVFRVAAVNVAGTGAVSVASAAIVPVRPTPPPMPTGVTAVPGDGWVSLAWSAPTSNGGAAISDYVVQVSSNAGATWSTFADGVSTATATTVTGLTNGTSYVFRVAAVNAAGTGAVSVASATILPRTMTTLPGYGVATSAVFYFSGGGWAGWSVPAGKVVLGAKIISPGDSIADFAVFKAAGPEEVFPHYSYGPAEYGWVMQAKQPNEGVQIEVYYADPPTIDVQVSPASVAEDSKQELIYTFTASAVTATPITVKYHQLTSDRSATEGVDFTGLPPGTGVRLITILANATTAAVTVRPTPDLEIEPDETVDLALLQGIGYSFGSKTVATGTIENDDFVVDLDVDSDNSGSIARSLFEDSIEDDPTRPGVIVPVGGGQAQMIVDVPAGRTATLAFDADAASKVRVSPASGMQVLPNGTRVIPVSGGSPQTFWIEAFAPSASLADIAFTLTLDVSPGSGSTGSPPSDTICATAVAVDLDVDSDNDGKIDPDNGPAGTDDPIEEVPSGRIIFVNSDDDNRNGVADLLDVGRVAGEDDLGEVLLALTPSLGPAVGTLIIAYDETIVRLYSRPDRSGGIVSGGPIPAAAPVYAEGRIAGTTVVTVTWTVGGLRASDTVRLTVQPYPATIDVDVDSDNNNAFGPPDRSEWEDTLENHEYAIGKLIMLDNPQRNVTWITLQMPTGLPADTVRIRLDWNEDGPAGSVRLWKKAVIDDFRNPAPVDRGGDWILPGGLYKLSDLFYDAHTGRASIYAEGIRENEQLKTLAGVEAAPRVDERIRGTLVVNGDAAAFDEVKYIVANEDSFYYALHTRQEVRNALASRGVYEFVDLPKFSLERKSPKDLGLGDSDEFPLSPNVPGFKAMVYQDYITGDRQYVLAFGGTDDLSYSGGIWDGDWNNNLRQAIGWQAPQFMEAMKIANDLARNPKIPKGNLGVTGHSLGGGLASAAAVVAGAPADTFNASWLSPETLLTSKDNGTPLRLISINPLVYGYELYPGALDRLYTARDTIDAYFVDYDILTRVQQVTGVVLDKLLIAPVGSMTKLDSPYDVDIWVAGLPSFGTVAATIMLRCHSMNVVLYGLLVKEGSPTVDMLGYSLDDLRR